MNILNIHGLRKEIDDNGNVIPFDPGDKIDILKKYGNVYNPELKYFSNPNLFKLTSEIIIKNDIDCLVGHSAGGYLVFYLSNFFKIPAYIINPAIAENCLAPKLQICPTEYKNTPIFNKQLIVIGNRDRKDIGGVDFNLVIDFLSKIDFFKININLRIF